MQVELSCWEVGREAVREAAERELPAGAALTEKKKGRKKGQLNKLYIFYDHGCEYEHHSAFFKKHTNIHTLCLNIYNSANLLCHVFWSFLLSIL